VSERVPETDPERMALALEEARLAAREDEVPIGAVILAGSAASLAPAGIRPLLARACNRTRASGDPTAHAELLAIRAAVRAFGHERLVGCTLYTTLEPCIMCAGALLHARVERVVFGARDPKFGGVVSLLRVFDAPGSNHRVRWEEGCLAEEARVLLRDFFRTKRAVRGARPTDAAERWQSG
jgi:tRNA(adenine34) deaminase